MSDSPSTAIVSRAESMVTRSPQGHAIIAVFPPDRRGDQPIVSIVKQTANGIIKSMLTHVPLKVENGELWELVSWVPPENKGGAWVKKVTRAITAVGYYKLNQFLGVSFISPTTVLGDDGKEHSNPWICRDEEGEIMFVRVRRVGVGRNPQGNLIAVDYTLTYDLGNHLRTDIFSKWTGKKSATVPQAWGKLLPPNIKKPSAEDLGNPAGVYHHYRVPGGVNLWVDLTNREVQTVLQEHLNKQRTAERNAQTMCERNILMRFVATRMVRPDGTVPVVGYVNADANFERILNKVNITADGKMDVDGEVIDVQKEDARVQDADEIDEALAGEVDPEDTTGDDADAPAEGAGKIDPEQPAEAKQDPRLIGLRPLIRDLAGELGAQSAEVKEILSTQDFASLGDVANCNDADKLEAVKQMLETAKLNRIQKSKTAQSGQGTLIDTELPQVEAPNKRKTK